MLRTAPRAQRWLSSGRANVETGSTPAISQCGDALQRRVPSAWRRVGRESTDVSRLRPRLRHEPALDGLRGVAIALVLLYHGGISWAGGGFLGVELFFVLSGYLITSLLLAEASSTGRIGFRAFWGRRARRLLPALACVVIACALYEHFAGLNAAPDFGADALATLAYVANWHQLWVGSGYFAQVANVSPLQHTWSLAIEEQFYLVWPLVVVAVLRLGRRRAENVELLDPAAERASDRVPTSRLAALLGLSIAGALASAAEMAWLFHGGSGLNRVYYGTDTRAQGLLAGAALAAATALARRRQRRPLSRSGQSVLAGAGLAGAGGLAAATAYASGTAGWLYQGGFLAVDVAAVAVIACAASPVARSPLGALLSWRPLRALGLVSYGVYLWHFPLFLWLTAASTGVSGAALFGLRCATTLAVAIVSYFVVEQPIRTRRVTGRSLAVLASSGMAAALVSVALAWSATGAEAALANLPALARPPAVHDRGPAAVGPAPAAAVPNGAAKSPLSGKRNLRVMVIGDSIGLTLGVELSNGEQRYGVSVFNRAILGCGFIDSGESDEMGTHYEAPNGKCLTAFRQWQHDEAAIRPQVVLVQMGYWDEMNWLQDGQVRFIGQPTFDRELRGRMDLLVRMLSAPRVRIVLLSVPYTHPLPWPDGSEPLQGSILRDHEINAMLQSVAKSFPGRVSFFDTSPEVTPDHRFSLFVDGALCRMPDGIHFALGTSPSRLSLTPCMRHLQAVLFPYLRTLVSS